MSDSKNKTIETPPIAFIIFNHPDYTKAVFTEIRKARPKKLFIIADGPHTPSEEAVCKETRAVVETIDWPCEVYRNYAEKNLGLNERFRSGLNWFFENVEEGIILEDDCLPHSSFFKFAGEMLERYRDNERIMMISGDKFLLDFSITDSYFFSRYFPIWGWATWRRAWKKYDVTIESWKLPESRKHLKKIYTQKYMISHASKLFDGIHSGKLNTWDVQWLYTCLMSDGLCIMPGKNLVSNIGISGTHQGGYNQNLPTYDIYTPGDLRHPETIIENTNYDGRFYERDFKPKPQTLWARLRRNIIAILVKYEFIKKIYRFLVKIKA